MRLSLCFVILKVHIQTISKLTIEINHWGKSHKICQSFKILCHYKINVYKMFERLNIFKYK